MIVERGCPLARKTTIVAPSRPTSVNSCQGSKGRRRDQSLLENQSRFLELIVQACVELGVDVQCRGRPRQRQEGETSVAPSNHEQAPRAEQIRQRPRQTVEALVDRLGERLLAAEFVDEEVQDLLLGLALLGQLAISARICAAVAQVHSLTSFRPQVPHMHTIAWLASRSSGVSAAVFGVGRLDVLRARGDRNRSERSATPWSRHRPEQWDAQTRTPSQAAARSPSRTQHAEPEPDPVDQRVDGDADVRDLLGRVVVRHRDVEVFGERPVDRDLAGRLVLVLPE